MRSFLYGLIVAYFNSLESSLNYVLYEISLIEQSIIVLNKINYLILRKVV